MTQPLPDDRAVYSITVAADLAGIGVQTLRLYERRGVLTPSRTDGGTRRYSVADIELAHRVVELLADGVNLAGVRRILELEADNAALRSQLADHAARGSRQRR